MIKARPYIMCWTQNEIIIRVIFVDSKANVPWKTRLPFWNSGGPSGAITLWHVALVMVPRDRRWYNQRNAERCRIESRASSQSLQQRCNPNRQLFVKCRYNLRLEAEASVAGWLGIWNPHAKRTGRKGREEGKRGSPRRRWNFGLAFACQFGGSALQRLVSLGALIGTRLYQWLGQPDNLLTYKL
jgi:hypothetical protein